MDINKASELVNIGSALFEIIEKRDLSYKICRVMIKSILFGTAIDIENTKNQLKQLISTVSEWIDYEKQYRGEIIKFIEEKIMLKLDEKHTLSLGMSFAIFLLSWNMNRFASYIETATECDGSSAKDNFGDFLIHYFKRINSIQSCIEDFKLKEKNIAKMDLARNKSEMLKFLECINRNLQIQAKKRGNGMKNEWVGTFKIAHILFPNLFIPVDNSIAKYLRVCKKQENWRWKWDFEEYFKFLEKISCVVKNMDETNLWESDDAYSILKKIDELFYMMFSTPNKKAQIIRGIFGLVDN